MGHRWRAVGFEEAKGIVGLVGTVMSHVFAHLGDEFVGEVGFVAVDEIGDAKAELANLDGDTGGVDAERVRRTADGAQSIGMIELDGAGLLGNALPCEESGDGVGIGVMAVVLTEGIAKVGLVSDGKEGVSAHPIWWRLGLSMAMGLKGTKDGLIDGGGVRSRVEFPGDRRNGLDVGSNVAKYGGIGE